MSRIGILTIALGVILSTAVGGVLSVSAQPQPEMVGSEYRDDFAVDAAIQDGSTQQQNRTNTSTSQSCHAAPATDLNSTREFRNAFENCTEISYASPPATAAVETTQNFDELAPGNESTSRYPSGATLTQTTALADAHVTVYGIHPSTRVQRTPETSERLIARNGTVRALVDYRLPDRSTVRSHGVEAVRLLYNGTVIDERTTPSQTPELEYHELPIGPAELTIVASVRVVREETIDASGTTRTNETILTLRDRRHVIVTAVTPSEISIRQAQSPVSERIVAVSHPYWQRISLTTTAETPSGTTPEGIATTTPRNDEATVSVQNEWRFHTAVDESWSELYSATAAGVAVEDDDFAPRYVHAVRPQKAKEPIVERNPRSTVREVTRWSRADPRSLVVERSEDGTLGADTSSRTRSGVTFRVGSDTTQPFLSVAGLVRGTNTSINLSEAPSPPIRQPSLTITVFNQTESTATLVVRLRDNQTGAPIAVSAPGIPNSSNPGVTEATLFVDGTPVTTDEQGRVFVHVDEYGAHSARFEPSVLTTTAGQQAYSATTATVSWHPLRTVSGWVSLATTLLRWAVFAALLAYAGRRLGRFVRPRNHL